MMKSHETSQVTEKKYDIGFFNFLIAYQILFSCNFHYIYDILCLTSFGFYNFHYINLI